MSAGGRTVLGPVRLSVAAGEVVAILGPSGAGKSTLLRAVNRLLPAGHRLSGRVRLGGRPTAGRGEALVYLRRAAGMLLQRPVAFPGSVAENILLPRREAGLPATLEEAARFARQAGLPEGILGRPATDLSGGELQRLALARALALEPGVLLLDEPTSALDPLSTRVVEAALQALAGRVTLLWVTHSPQQARRVARRALVLWGGRILADGDIEGLRRRPEPEVRALLEG